MRAPGGSPAVAGLILLVLLLGTAVAAPLLAPHDPIARVGPPFAAPSADHLLGTNDVGQDLLSELIYGARVSLAVGIVAALAATVVGLTVGLVAGYARGLLDAVLMRLVDVVLSLPFLPLMIVVGVFVGPGLVTQMLVIAGVMWAGTARELRAQVLAARELDHVQAARAMGGRPARVLRLHVLPEVAPLVVPQFVLATKTAILLEASLAFLGLGDPSAKSWGTTLFYAHARSAFLTDAWLWWVVPPGACIAAAVLAFGLLGYAMEERARPRLRHWSPARRSPPARSAPGVADGKVPASGAQDAPVLAVEELTVAYETPDVPFLAVDGVSLTVAAGEVVGLVGESGSGKSTVVAAATGLLRPPATVVGGRVRMLGDDLATLPPAALRRLRGDRVALVPQQAMHALNPVLRIGDQVAEAVTAHRRAGRAEARRRAAELLELVGIAPDRAADHPHQLSGGMRQRVVLAMALANDPALLVADEPTTGLDVVVQAEILDLLGDLRRRLRLAMLVVSHDLPVVLELADRLAVMRHGRIAEEGPATQVVARPSHPYTRTLIDATPWVEAPAAAGAGAGRR